MQTKPLTASSYFTTTRSTSLYANWFFSEVYGVKSYKNYMILTIIANFVIYACEQNHDLGEHSEQGDDVWEHLSGLTGKGETLSEL